MEDDAFRFGTVTQQVKGRLRVSRFLSAAMVSFIRGLIAVFRFIEPRNSNATPESDALPTSCRETARQYLNIFAAPMFAPVANNASTPSLDKIVSQPPPKLMSWCSASIAQPVGTQ